MKFNVPTKKAGTTTNFEGAQAFVVTPAMELYTAVVTAGLSDQFYEKADDKLKRIAELIQKNDADFVAKLAVYAREHMYLRSIPLVLTVELAKLHQGDGLIAVLTERVIQRADEITELLSYYAVANQRSGSKQLNRLSKQMQKGLAASFNKFDEYQFAKYNRQTVVKLRDALFLVHPKGKDEAQQLLFDKIVKNELATPYTWEVELSELGQQKFASEAQKKTAFKAKWEELISSNKIGYMALLRNLRNILEAEVSTEALNKVCAYISNPNAVAGSKQFPFRFLAAYRELKDINNGRTGKVLETLEEAAIHSAANIAGYDEATKVVVAADVSGSMQKPVSAHSKVQYYDIGLMLAMMLQSRCEHVVAGMFGDVWKVIQTPRKNILASADEFHRREGEVGYSTNGYLVIRYLLQRRKIADKIMMFTDCQLWNSYGKEHIADLWKQYKKLAPAAKLYLFDLAGYGNTPLRIMQDEVYLIAGWSDKIFDVLNSIENGTDAVAVINSIKL